MTSNSLDTMLYNLAKKSLTRHTVHQILPKNGNTSIIPGHHPPQKTVNAALCSLSCGPRNSIATIATKAGVTIYRSV